MSVLTAPSGRSGELTRSTTDYVSLGKMIRCLHDNIIVEPLETDHSEVIDVIENTKPLRGIVRAVGPGHFPMKYDHPEKHKRTRMWRSEKFQPTQVKVGDIVELGSLREDGGNFIGYSFPQIMWGNKLHLMCREADVCVIVEAE